MPFYQRGLLYLTRKRAKSILLLMIFLFVNSMILGTNMILHAAQSTEAAMKKKTKAKAVCEMTDAGQPVTEEDARGIGNLDAVTSINRMGQQAAYLPELLPVTGNTSTEADNQKVSLLSFDDMETDSPFADQSFRLTEGRLIGPESRYCAVVNQGFAQANELKVGDTFSLENEEGKKTTVEIIGEYLAGNETRQEKENLALYRQENQVYIDNTAYLELFGEKGFYKLSAYVSQPELLDSLAGEMQEIVGEKAEITTSDTLYQQMKAPLTQITRVVSLMRLLAFGTGTAVVSLLLCMWMRSRQKEMAVFLSMGEGKSVIFWQALLESAVVFLLALLGACVLGTAASGWMQELLLATVDTGASLTVTLQAGDIAQLLGIGGAVVGIGVLLSLIPVLRSNPKDILSRMEG
ncbi:ABC transporter ATP-binding protein [Blautia sp. An249]|uniref:ABC transporter permease n=1 Tax=Blautia sp. An249 TaxID=1965603 RepID=UPI000B3A42C4|nr:FtsX-like permease family protein [Blautia sp. An249]OUO72612.1 ABC transporter ATP-binding protein [Blautia sp. An249]